MRSIILLGLGSAGLVVGLTAFGGGVESDQEPLAPPVDLVGIETTDVAPGDSPDLAMEPSSPEPVADPATVEVPAAEVAATPEPEPQPRSWRSRRNRFPAPDFTPAEWQPPEGPVRIALQAGHWRAHEAPDELDGLKTGGTHAAGIAEWEVNLALAERTGEMLVELGYEVDILPAVVPPDYHAHLFIAIHADGATDPAARGYRVAAPSRDYTGRAQQMVDLLRDTYGEATGLRRLPDVTRRMRNYYAFNVRRYEHSLDPRTIALILETGFLTSPSDREVIVNDPDRVARGIVEAVKAFPITALPAESEPSTSADPGTAPGR
jgi:hypothetical protein